MDYEIIKWLHILSSTLLFGTGLGSAFYKWCADRSGNLEVITHTNRMVVIADWTFTTPTIVLQPLTGMLLLHILGVKYDESWLVATYILYIIAGVCWLPVVWMQIRMRDLSLNALTSHAHLDKTYHRLARFWFWLGIPAFASTVLIYLLMVSKPGLDL